MQLYISWLGLYKKKIVPFELETIILIILLFQDSDAKGFEKCYQQSVRCSKGFLDQLVEGKVN